MLEVTPDDEQRNHTAYHEAAHVVIAFYYGWGLTPRKGVQIDGAPCAWIRVTYPHDDGLLAVKLAGWVAEMLALQAPDRQEADLEEVIRAVRWNDDDQGGDDFEAFQILLAARPDATDQELVAAYREHQRRTRDILELPYIWPAVQNIAEALLAQGRLHDKQARAIYLKSLKAPKAPGGSE